MTDKFKVNGKQLGPAALALIISEAEGWRPEEGSELEGTVLGVKLAYSDVSESEYPIVFVMPKDWDPDKGEAIAVHGFGAVLKNELIGQRPELGDTIYIRRGGEREATRKGWSGAINYAVLVTKPGVSGRSVWDAMGPAQPKLPTTKENQFNDDPPF